MRSWYHSKTVWFNVLMTIVDSAAYFQGTQLLGESVMPYLIGVQGIGNIVLRIWFSKQPIGKINSATLDHYILEEDSRRNGSGGVELPVAGVAAVGGVAPKAGGAGAATPLAEGTGPAFFSSGGLMLEPHFSGEFFKGSSATLVVALKYNEQHIAGAHITADYYTPTNASFLQNQLFTEIDSTGMYHHTLPIPADAQEGVYKVIIQANKKRGGENFSDTFGNPQENNWRVISGDWVAENGGYRQKREEFGNSSVVANPEALEWVDYSFEADVKWDSAKGGKLGILGRWLSPTVFYALYFDPALEGGKLVLWRGSAMAQSVDYPFSYPSESVRLKMDFVGNSVKCYVNGTLRLDFTDPTPVTRGTAGLFTQDIAASFGNVSVIQRGEQASTSLITDLTIKPSPATRSWNWEV